MNIRLKVVVPVFIIHCAMITVHEEGKCATEKYVLQPHAVCCAFSMNLNLVPGIKARALMYKWDPKAILGVHASTDFEPRIEHLSLRVVLEG